MPTRKNMSIIDHAASVLRMFEIEPGPLNRLIERYFKQHRELGSGERRAIADAAFGVARWRRRLDGLLTTEGVRKPAARDRVGLLLELGGGIEEVSPQGFPGGEAAYHSFPDFLYEMLRDQYGTDGAGELAKAMNRSIPPTLRINSLRIERSDAIRRLAEAGVESSPTDLSPYGMRLAGRMALGSLDLFTEGLVEIQDEASQLAVVLSSPSEGESVLDVCAGAGGKSLMIAMLMNDKGRIVAADVEGQKLRELRKRAKRAGVNIISAKEIDVREEESQDKFDLVFVDAPCTGTGTIGRNPDLRWRIDEDTIESRVKLQREILEASANFVRPNGRLVYATCSLLRQENENVVESLLSKGNFAIEDAREIIGRSGVDAEALVEEDGYYRADPRKGRWDGFFAASMKNVCG